MQWFKHDSAATTDAKIKKLIIKHGAIGYAVYFHCLELIVGNTSETNTTFELEHDSEIIADDLRIQGNATESGSQIVEKIMRSIIDLKLFEQSEGHIFCFKLLKRLDSSMTSNKRMREIIQNGKERYSFLENHDKVMTQSCCNHDYKSKSHDTVMLEEIEKIEKKENLYMPQAQTSEEYPVDNFEDDSVSPSENAGNRIDSLREYWNQKGLIPMRLNIFNFTDIDRQSCMGIVSFYSDEDIKNAIDNYVQILNDKEHYSVPFPYQSFTGFMSKGVEKFFKDAKPFERFTRHDNVIKTPKKGSQDFTKYDKIAEEYRKRCGYKE